MLAKLRTFSLVGHRRRCRSRSKSTFPTALCPKPYSSGCPRRPSRRARIGSSGRWSTRASCGRRIAWSSIWLRPSCRSRPPRSICRSRWASWPAAGSWTRLGDRFRQYAVVGELALDGSTRPTHGALSMAMAAARRPGLRGLLVPSESAAEAAVVEGIEAIRRLQPGAGRGVSHRPDRYRAHAAAARRMVQRPGALRRRLCRRAAARRWPSGRSRSRPPVRIIC